MVAMELGCAAGDSCLHHLIFPSISSVHIFFLRAEFIVDTHGT